MPVNDGDVPDYNDERARHEREKRLLAELARQEKERELLRREDVTQAWTQAVNLTRVKLLGVPSTVKQRIPHLEVEEIEVITGLIREALEELANGEVKA
jgi:phage terminase Nu1 subunit (DNA packaging protein)